MSARAEIVVIGLGSVDRGDDGIGPAVARAIQARASPGVAVVWGARDGAWILDAWRERSGAVVVDCIRSGQPPGTIRRIDPMRGPFVDSASTSTHGLGLASAVELGRALGDLPRRLALVGVEGARFELGLGLSPPVREAVAPAAALALKIVAGWQGRGPATSPGEVSDA